MRVQKESVGSEKSNGLRMNPGGEEEKKAMKETEKEQLEDDLAGMVLWKPREQGTLRKTE